MKGICCVCQCEVDISQSRLAYQQVEEMGWEHWQIEQEYGNSIHYLCDPHQAWGEHW